ncbi:hypothetical protein ACMGGR_09235 [Erwinia sp. BNK-24-b]|uniref:hypothetical protein n=1 Tax=unclassified Erwinia TaxID=2622719 RepID=UPI0039BFA3FB
MSASSKNLKPCFAINSNLDQASVDILLSGIADVLGQLWANKHKLDSNWITGCRAYGWVKEFIEQNYQTLPGVAVVSTAMDFVFSLNKVPLQFVTDRLDRPRKRHRLLRNEKEQRQISIFDEEDTSNSLIWRIYAERFIDDVTDQEAPPTWIITMVGLDESGRKVSLYEHVSKVITPVSSAPNDTNLKESKPLPAPNETPPMKLKRRGNKIDKDQSGKNGTI